MTQSDCWSDEIAEGRGNIGGIFCSCDYVVVGREILLQDVWDRIDNCSEK